MNTSGKTASLPTRTMSLKVKNGGRKHRVPSEKTKVPDPPREKLSGESLPEESYSGEKKTFSKPADDLTSKPFPWRGRT